ncbi:MAG: hypothetical protein C0609_03040 [Deltaproteobacteria bacterium]|nr:MAG: hypothetical protein C0609_03040 [Deltaproteobacteria bacterium]
MIGHGKNALSGLVAALAVVLLLSAIPASAAIVGLEGTSFNLTAKAGYITTPDGGSYLSWGYANGDGPAQYPGPTLIVNEGDTVTVTLTNELATNVSMIFPGMASVTAKGGKKGLFTREAEPAKNAVTYTFVAEKPGTYMYQSGTRPELQIEMGLFGAIIVRSATQGQAYDSEDTAYDDEFLFLLSEVDPVIHEQMELGMENMVDNTKWEPVIWMINGRSAPDTMAPNYAPWLPHQPYNCMPNIEAGQTLLIRLANAGRDLHPFHTHGNHSTIVGRYGNLLESVPGAGADLAVEEFTVQMVPGSTVDSLFTWTGEGIGWDVYGHQSDINVEPLDDFPGPGDVDHNGDGIVDWVDMMPHESAADHGKPFPVVLPDPTDLAFGGFYSGSPYLGLLGNLPPGEGGLNPKGGFAYMWHSHTEKEMVNFDIFPGGMMTMFIVTAPGSGGAMPMRADGSSVEGR